MLPACRYLFVFQFEEISSARFQLEARNRELEDELRVLNVDLEHLRERDVSSGPQGTKHEV